MYLPTAIIMSSTPASLSLGQDQTTIAHKLCKYICGTSGMRAESNIEPSEPSSASKSSLSRSLRSLQRTPTFHKTKTVSADSVAVSKSVGASPVLTGRSYTPSTKPETPKTHGSEPNPSIKSDATPHTTSSNTPLFLSRIHRATSRTSHSTSRSKYSRPPSPPSMYPNPAFWFEGPVKKPRPLPLDPKKQQQRAVKTKSH